MNAKLLLRWFIPFVLYLLISFGCTMNEVKETYFPPLSAHTAIRATSTVHDPSRTTPGILQTELAKNTQDTKIECNEDGHTHHYEVSAYDHSTAYAFLNTHISIHPGDRVQIIAGGIACLDPNPQYCYGPDGDHHRLAILVGKVGGGEMFSIGSNFERTFDSESGYLFLAFMDSDYENNSGFYDVCVTVY